MRRIMKKLLILTLALLVFTNTFTQPTPKKSQKTFALAKTIAGAAAIIAGVCLFYKIESNLDRTRWIPLSSFIKDKVLTLEWQIGETPSWLNTTSILVLVLGGTAMATFGALELQKTDQNSLDNTETNNFSNSNL